MKCKSLLFVCLLLSVFFLYNGYTQTESLKNSSVQLQDSSKNVNETDTILKWKQNRQFAYMNYLDSLLRKQKYLRSDTVSFDENTGTIIRKRSSEKRLSSATKVMNSLPLRIFFWILAIVFIVFICYKVLFQNAIFTTKKKKFTSINNEEPEEALQNSDYDTLIDIAEKSNKFNDATRYLFLKTLKNLSEKGLIDYAPQKTNKDYLKEMYQNKYFTYFQKLTSDYEYAWYGKFLIDKRKYLQIKEQFCFFNEKV